MEGRFTDNQKKALNIIEEQTTEFGENYDLQKHVRSTYRGISASVNLDRDWLRSIAHFMNDLFEGYGLNGKRIDKLTELELNNSEFRFAVMEKLMPVLKEKIEIGNLHDSHKSNECMLKAIIYCPEVLDMIEYEYDLDSSEYFTIFTRSDYRTNSFLKKAILANPKVLYTKNFQRYIEENPGKLGSWEMIKSNPSELLRILEENPDEMRFWDEVKSNPEFYHSDTRIFFDDVEEKELFEIMIAKGFYQEIQTEGKQNENCFTELVQSICARELELEKTGNDNNSFDSIIRVLIERSPLESIPYLLDKDPNLMNLRGVQEMYENCQDPEIKKRLDVTMAKADHAIALRNFAKAQEELNRTEGKLNSILGIENSTEERDD